MRSTTIGSAALLLVCLSGCLFVPYPVIDRVPSPEVRNVYVVDAQSRQPIADATVTGFVFRRQNNADWLTSSLSDGPPRSTTVDSLRTQEIPVDKISFERVEGDRFEAKAHFYLDWGYFFDWLITFWIKREHFHFAWIVVDAPGYQSIAVGVESIDPTKFMIARVNSEKPLTLNPYWSEPEREPYVVDIDADGSGVISWGRNHMNDPNDANPISRNPSGADDTFQFNPSSVTPWPEVNGNAVWIPLQRRVP